jgi:hypothetical protein
MLLRSYAETFPGTPDQVARVRREVRAYLDGCPAADDVVLIVSELVSNAIMHSLSRVGTFSVCVQIHPAYIYAEVEDDGGPWYCPQQDGRPHGLEVVTLDRPGFFGGPCLPDAINLPFFPAPRSSFPHILSGECTCRRSAGARCYTSQPIPGSRA